MSKAEEKTAIEYINRMTDKKNKYKIQLYGLLYDFYRTESDIKKYEALCLEFLDYVDHDMSERWTPKLCFSLSVIYRKYGDYEKAVTYIQDAITYYTANNNQFKLAILYNTYANIYWDTNDYSKALEYYYKAYQFIQSQPNSDLYFLIKENLAGLYILLNYFDKAKNLYLANYDQLVKEKKYGRIGEALQGIAEIYLLQGNNFLAYKYGKRAMENWSKAEDKIGFAYAMSTFGNVLSKHHRFLEAVSYFEQSNAIFNELIIKKGLVRNFQFMGATYYEMQRYKESIENLEKAEKMASDMKLNYELKNIYSVLYKAYEKNGEESKAYQTIKSLYELNDRFFNLSLQVKVNEIQTNFELEKKELEYQNERNINEYKNNLFSYLTHEFRTPLTLIKTPLELIENETNPERIKERIKDASLQIVHMQNLVNQLLDINKLEEGKMPIVYKVGSVVPLMWSIIRSYENQMKDKSIAFEYSMPSKDIQGYFDEDKLEKIVNNLLGNAIKYTHEHGKIILQVSFKSNSLVINVKDDGVGIPKAFQKEVFNKFFRIPSSINAKGSGIGLSFVKEIVELMEGSIVLNSEEGEGAEFIVEIPFKRLYETKKPKDSDIAVSKEVSLPVIKKPRMLIVEDNVEIQKLIKEIFIDQFQIYTAKNGVEGLSETNRVKPDVIITDLMMPKMDGIEMLKNLKEDVRSKNIPVLILSAKSQIYDKIQGLEYGAEAYITKPFHVNEIKTSVESILNNRKKLMIEYSENPLIANQENMISMDKVLLNEITDYIHQHLSNENLSVVELANHLNMSRYTLIRKMKRIIDQSPNNFIQKVRLEKAKEMLKNKVASISEIAYKVGFASTTYFTYSFKKEFNVTPKEFQKKENR
jgi:signal transduction histidine kinase/DNA-binding response OmpR family regulator